MEIVLIPLDEIHVGARQRPVDPGKAVELAKSIEQVGLLQAIGLVPDTSGPPSAYRLVFGAHRLEAMRLLEHLAVPAYVLPADLLEEEYLLIELQENSARNDLTGAERKGYAAEAGRLLDILTTRGHADNVHGFWLEQLSTKVGVDRRTLLRWWQAFCENSGLTLTPRQALAPHKEQFFTWLEAQRRQAEEEKARREAVIMAEQRELCLQDVQEALVQVIEDYGWEVVYDTVLGPLLEQYDA